MVMTIVTHTVMAMTVMMTMVDLIRMANRAMIVILIVCRVCSLLHIHMCCLLLVPPIAGAVVNLTCSVVSFTYPCSCLSVWYRV